MSNEKLSNSIAYLKIRQIFAFVAICVFVVCLSFYFQNGYLDIGADKAYIFKKITFIIIPIWLILRLIDFVREREYLSLQNRINNLKAHDYFLILFVVSGGISTLTSPFRKTSLWGVDGWNMGYITQLAMVGLYLMMSDLTRALRRTGLRVLIGILLSVALVVFTLGNLNRFSIFPMYMFGEAEDFISTLGNINWYCGYWTIWTGVICGLFLAVSNEKKRNILGIMVWICALSGVCCGASSCYLAWMAISFAAFLVAMSDSRRMIRWVYMQILALLTLPCIRIIGWIRPNRMWYDSSWLKGVTYGQAWIWPFILGMTVCILLIWALERHPRDYSEFRGIIIGCSAGILLVLLTLAILNTKMVGGIWPARGHAFLYLDDSWGNMRGGIWRCGVQLLKDIPFFYRFFGVGCDCLSDYAYSYENMRRMLNALLGNNYLTNVHNELFTMLINEGVFGAIAYAGLLISHIRIALIKSKENALGLSAALVICAYIAIGMVGFMHLLSTPFLFLIMGMMAGLNAKSS